MAVTNESDEIVRVRAENVGGITETEIDLPSGVTVLSGRNATNRTSFLRAIMGAMGSDNVSLKGDARTGRIELSMDGETCGRTLSREGGDVATRGDAYLDADDVELADLFAFLLRENEARRAVVRDRDLREVMMRPVDTRVIQAEIEQLTAEKRRLVDELDQLEALEARRTELEETRTELESELAEYNDRLEEKRAALSDADGSLDDSKRRREKLDAVMEDLQAARSELEEAEFQLETERESLAGLREERAEIEADLEDLSDAPSEEIAAMEEEISRLRDHKQSLESTVSQLQRIIGFNEEVLSGDHREIHDALQADAGEGEVTDRLVSETAVCWTCGSDVDTETIRGTVDRLRDLREEKAAKRRDLESELGDLKEEKAAYERRQRERERLRERHERVVSEIEDREDAVEDLEDRRDDLAERIEDLEARAEGLERRERSEVLSVQKELNELEFERDRTESELEDVTGEIEEIESELDRRETLERDLETCRNQLTELRTRVERLETESVEAFNEHMATVLEVLQYENLSRIWIERTGEGDRGAPDEAAESSFELHVIRSTADGTSYEDSVDHLSESEREVTGLVFALAGYLVHDVHEHVPVMLLDSLEAIDSERIADLIEHFESFPDVLVVALLPEDARAVSDAHNYVEPP